MILDHMGHAGFDLRVEAEDIATMATRPGGQAFLNLPVGTVSDDGSVVVGEGGFLFIHDGSNQWKAQLSGASTISPNDLDAGTSALSLFESNCNARGISFRFVVVPEKDIVYSDVSPNVVGPIAAKRPYHYYAERLPFQPVYPLEQLLASKDLLRVYHRYDSHHNFFGGLIIANALFASLDVTPLWSLDVEHRSTQDDLLLKWLSFSLRRRVIKPVFEETVLHQPTGHMGLHLRFKNEAAVNKETAVVFGDSYSWNPDAGLARFLALRFRQVDFVWAKAIDWSLVDSLRAALVVFQSAERFLIRGIG